jgi:hypothetical protein
VSNTTRDILDKELRRFKHKFWLSELLKGFMIFIGTAIVWVVIVSVLEYFSWLSSDQRALLFWLTSCIVVVLLMYYILRPVFQLFVRGNGLSNLYAARYIGQKISEVDDRLVNYLELCNESLNDDLVDAGIAQKEKSLIAFSFSDAISYNVLKPFLLFLIVPLAMGLFFLVNQQWYIVKEGASRLLNYNHSYERAFPFKVSFSDDLVINEGESISIDVNFLGEFIADEIDIVSNSRKLILKKLSAGMYRIDAFNVTEEVDFRFVYDEAFSKSYKIDVKKRPVIGRIWANIEPPGYTGIESFIIDNAKEIEIPAGSTVSILYNFKNIENLALSASDSSILINAYSQGDTIAFIPKQNMTLSVRGGGSLLHEMDLLLIQDHAPVIEARIDSLPNEVKVAVSANDDYGIEKASINVRFINGAERIENLFLIENAVQTTFTFEKAVFRDIEQIELSAADKLRKVTKLIYIGEKKKTLDNELIGLAGLMDDLVTSNEDLNLASNELPNRDKRASLLKKSKNLKSKIADINRRSEEDLARLEELATRLEELLKDQEKIEKSVEQIISDKEIDAVIKALDKEWAILETLAELKKLDKDLEEKEVPSDDLMKSLENKSTDLQSVLNEDERNSIEWNRLDSIKSKQSELKENDLSHSDSEEEKKGSEDGQTDEQSEENEELIEQMKEDSKSLQSQLAEMSSMMKMEELKKNIALLRRLEIRALNVSFDQEVLVGSISNTKVIDVVIRREQKTVISYTEDVLDSLGVVMVTDDLLGAILKKNESLLREQLGVLKSQEESLLSSFISNQRYLQYALNDLASVLYDILTSEQQQMQGMLAGSKECNNPKSGKGRKKSLSQQQKELGDKLGKMIQSGYAGKKGTKGKPNNGLLELIKGQEQLLEMYKQEGGQQAGDKGIIEDVNQQLEDLINGNLDKAYLRNKSIEDKLIDFEWSKENKPDLEDQRKSTEGTADYDGIKQQVNQQYLFEKQRELTMKIIPVLNIYYGRKWREVSK